MVFPIGELAMGPNGKGVTKGSSETRRELRASDYGKLLLLLSLLLLSQSLLLLIAVLVLAD